MSDTHTGYPVSAGIDIPSQAELLRRAESALATSAVAYNNALDIVKFYRLTGLTREAICEFAKRVENLES